AVLFVQAIVAVAAIFGAANPVGWITQMAVLTGAALPAVLAWLLCVCAFKRKLGRMEVQAQWACGVGLGVLAGLYGCGLLVLMGLANPAPWVASGASGALVAAVLVGALVWRAKARMPAGTTARLAELQARIRPHFLFNTLNSAIALVREEPAKAESLLEDLSELFRHALADAQEAVPLWQELELAEHYLAIEQVRFGDLARRGLAGPAVTGVIVPRLVMPADSATRWRPDEKTLILAHEHAHIERGDLRVNSVVALLQCLFWCNPLAHVAAMRFRFDQELACDATVMAMQVGRRRLYAEALLKADSVVGAPFSCSWGDVGRGALETRVTSLRLPHHAPSPTAVLTATGLALAIAGAAWAVQPASPEQTQDPRPRILNLRLLPPQASPQPVRTAETA
ncbi:MAG: hypothetical protein B7Y99_13750, partial [Caulobacterales bacterium 32-69-10]